MAATLGKADIVNRLATIHGLRWYLEICTTTTGAKFADIDRARLNAHRLMYRCPAEHSDGLPINFRSTDADISDCIRTIGRRNLHYDIALVDSYHEYETSF